MSGSPTSPAPVLREAAEGCIALVLFSLLFPPISRASEPDAAPEVVIAGGQEELLGDMLGRGVTFAGACKLTGAEVAPAAIKSTYECPNGDVVLELSHPSRAAADATRTSRFAIKVLSGAPPADFLPAWEERIRSRENVFQWTRLAREPPPPLPSPMVEAQHTDESSAATLQLVAAALVGTALLAWAARRSLGSETSWLRIVSSNRELRWVAAIFVVSALARGWVGAVNWQANDDHFSVAHRIIENGWRPPPSSDCMECSHPKLYHYMLALAFELTDSERGTRKAGNLLNFVAGTILFALLYAYSRGARIHPTVRVLAIGFVSFNAALVGAFSQATNDGFCILFSSLTIFYLDRFLTDFAWKHMVAATVFVILAALSKASGWAIFAAAVVVLLCKLVAGDARMRRKLAVPTAVFVLGFLFITSSVNPYRENILQRGTPFVNDAFDAPMVKMEVPRPPYAWIVQDFFTFRYFELLRAPSIDWGAPTDPPSHRESLWSQVYGQTLFLRFTRHIWKPTDPRVDNVGRLCLALGLLPLAALLVGTADRLWSVWRALTIDGFRWLSKAADWHHLIYAGVILAAMIAVVVEYHRTAMLFTWMKAIYLLPAVLPFFGLFLGGLERIWRRWPRLVGGWMVAMVLASMVDLAWLVRDVTALMNE